MPEQPLIVSNPAASAWSRPVERLQADTAGRFTILREIGRGGFATVFLAQQLKPRRRVAIKLLAPQHAESQWAVEHFRDESQKVAEWRHPSIVTIYEVHEVEDLLYFVMSYVEGGSLHDVIKTAGPLPIATVRSILAQVGSALQYAHRQGLMHRDIKPPNILIDVDGGAVVTDFGIAKDTEGPSHTVVGTVVGTVPYMAPEQLSEGGKATFASDQYALGIVAYEMLTGSTPFTGSMVTVSAAHLSKPVPPISERRPDCPPELESAVLRMLAKDPAARFPTVIEAIVAAGASELMEFHPDRQALAAVARRIAARRDPPVLEMASVPPSFEVGDELPLEVRARTIAGELLSDFQISVSVTDSAIAQVDVERGVLRAVAPGLTTMLVRGEGVQEAVNVEIRPAVVVSLPVSGLPEVMQVGEQAQLVAEALGKHGTPVGSVTSWMSARPGVATVDADGVLRALSEGTTALIASAGDVKTTLLLRVAPPPVAEVRIGSAASTLTVGDLEQLECIVRDAAGNRLTGRSVHWRSSDGKIARVTDTGLVTAYGAGSVVITAECEGLSATTTLEVPEPRRIAPPEPVQPDRAVTGATARPVPSSTALIAAADDVVVDGELDAVQDHPPEVALDAELGQPPARSNESPADEQTPAVIATADAQTSAGGAPTVADHAAPGHGLSRMLRVSAGVLTLLIAVTAVVLWKPWGQPSGNGQQTLEESPATGGNMGAGPSGTGTPLPPQQPEVAGDTTTIPPEASNIVVSIVPQSLSMRVGDTRTLRADVSPADTSSPVQWRSENPTLATVTSQGRVRALGVGRARIIAQAGDAAADTIIVAIAAPAPVAPQEKPTVVGPPPPE